MGTTRSLAPAKFLNPIARNILSKALLFGVLFTCVSAPSFSTEGGYVEDGKYMTKDDEPTYNVQQDGTVDWYTYSGFRRYHSECHVCHGPDGLGSTYAPALATTMKTMSYDDFFEVVINGRKTRQSGQESVMPGFGTNPNVTCYMDDLYVYLVARAADAVPRGRPRKREAKPAAAKEDENACRGD